MASKNKSSSDQQQTPQPSKEITATDVAGCGLILGGAFAAAESLVNIFSKPDSLPEVKETVTNLIERAKEAAVQHGVR